MAQGTHSRERTESSLVTRLESMKLKLADPIDTPTLVVVGATCAGKDTLLSRLLKFRMEQGATSYGDYYKVQYRVPEGSRQKRASEAIAQEPGPIEESEEALVAHQLLFYYLRDGCPYVFTPEDFKRENDIPMIHIADEAGLSALVDAKRIEERLTIFLNINGLQNKSEDYEMHNKDIKRRATTRLAKELAISTEDVLNSHQSDFKKTVCNIKRTNREFNKKRNLFDAIYKNMDPGDEGIRSIIYRNGKDSVIDDLAYRVNELFHRYVDTLQADKSRGRKTPTPFLHHKYVHDIFYHLFGKMIREIELNPKGVPRTNLQPTTDLHRLVKDYAGVPTTDLQPTTDLHRLVKDYAVTSSGDLALDETVLHDYLSKVGVNYINKAKSEGILYVKLKPQMKDPLTIQTLREIVAVPHADYHVLRLFGERIYNTTRTRPKYMVDKKNNIIGITCSLSDERPEKKVGRQVYYRITLMFDY